MSLILEQIIHAVLKEHVDSNLESETARNKIAEEISSIYYASSSDWYSTLTNELIGEENEELDK